MWELVAFCVFVLGYWLGRRRGKRQADRRSFITGSQAYGDDYRSPGSDLDLVIWVSEETLEQLQPYVVHKVPAKDDGSLYGASIWSGRIKMGGIDLILTSREIEYDRWFQVTNALKERDKEEVLTRDAAVAAFKVSKPFDGSY